MGTREVPAPSSIGASVATRIWSKAAVTAPRIGTDGDADGHATRSGSAGAVNCTHLDQRRVHAGQQLVRRLRDHLLRARLGIGRGLFKLGLDITPQQRSASATTLRAPTVSRPSTRERRSDSSALATSPSARASRAAAGGLAVFTTGQPRPPGAPSSSRLRRLHRRGQGPALIASSKCAEHAANQRADRRGAGRADRRRRPPSWLPTISRRPAKSSGRAFTGRTKRPPAALSAFANPCSLSSAIDLAQFIQQHPVLIHVLLPLQSAEIGGNRSSSGLASRPEPRPSASRPFVGLHVARHPLGGERTGAPMINSAAEGYRGARPVPSDHVAVEGVDPRHTLNCVVQLTTVSRLRRRCSIAFNISFELRTPPSGVSAWRISFSAMTMHWFSRSTTSTTECAPSTISSTRGSGAGAASTTSAAISAPAAAGSG